MKNLDSLTLKFFYEENSDFLTNGVIQKIQMPKRTEILFYIRNQGENRKFYINIDPRYPHVCFIKDKEDYLIKIPKSPPMFCMQLRKYLEGAKIIKTNLVPYDRILEFYFSTVDEFGIENSLVLAIELMGKYSNVILYNKKTELIIGSAHNVSFDKSSIREIYGGIKYIYPKKQEKKDILKVSYSGFFENSDDIPNNFYYFSKPFFKFLAEKAANKEELFTILQNAVLKPDLIKEFRQEGEFAKDFNEIIFNYFSKIVNSDIISGKKNKISKIINSKIKKADSVIGENIDLEKFEKYKRAGDLIFQYIYLIEKGAKKIELEGISVDLNENLTPAENAQKYYKLYSKLKSAKLVWEKRKEDAKKEKQYLEEILFSSQNTNSLTALDEIEEEINEFILQKKTLKSEKPKVEAIDFKGFEILIGKNNRQNDYIIKKLSAGEDIWLHAANCPSSHVIIKTGNGKKQPDNEVLLFAANLVKNNSPLKNSFKAGIIYTKRKYIKRPPDTPLGYVTYEKEKEIII